MEFTNLLSTSEYRVFAKWTGGANRASDASFVISSAAWDEFVVKNQKLGGQFVKLGDFIGPQKVSLTNELADGFVIADSV